MEVLSPVPEVPQNVALSEQVVTSVFVTWRPPPGQVEGYKVRHVNTSPVQFQVIKVGETAIKALSARATSRLMFVLICLTHTFLKQLFLQRTKKATFVPHSPVGYLGTVSDTTDLVTGPLKMYELSRATTREDDQAHSMHTQYQPTEVKSMSTYKGQMKQQKKWHILVI